MIDMDYHRLFPSIDDDGPTCRRSGPASGLAAHEDDMARLSAGLPDVRLILPDQGAAARYKEAMALAREVQVLMMVPRRLIRPDEE